MCIDALFTTYKTLPCPEHQAQTGGFLPLCSGTPLQFALDRPLPPVIQANILCHVQSYVLKFFCLVPFPATYLVGQSKLNNLFLFYIHT